MPAAVLSTSSAVPAQTRAAAGRREALLPASAPAASPVRQTAHQQAAAALGAALVSLAVACAPAPAAAADLKLGQEVFKANCAVCHAGGLNNIPGEEKHTLKRDALQKYGLFSQQAIESQVRSGKDAMPPFEGSLSDEEIAAVAAFVYRQAAGDLW